MNMSVLTGSAAAVKYLLFFFNLLFVITGIILLAVGATVQGVYHGYSEFLDSQYHSIPVFLVVIGVIILLIAFFGCCGAYKENYCMVLTFSSLMILVFVLELAGGISGYVLRDHTGQVLREQLESSMKNYGNPNFNDTTQLWDTVQRDFTCCGLTNVTDWTNNHNTFPLSCCPQVFGAMYNETCTVESAFPHGCLEEFGTFIKAHAISLGGVGIGVAMVQFIGIFFACYIARTIRNKNYAMSS